MKKPVAIQMTVAKELGISQSTVSRALRRPDMVRDATLKRIQKAFAKHGYQPDELANRFREGSLGLIGVSVNSLFHPYFPSIIDGAQREAARHGWGLAIECTHDEQEAERKAIEIMRSLRFVGALVNPHPEAHEFFKRLLDSDFPVVMIDRFLDGVNCSYIGTDNRMGAHLAVEHLVSLGHRRIAMIHGPQEYSSHRDRLTGYREAMVGHGLSVDKRWIMAGSWTVEGGRSAGTRLLSLPSDVRPTAIFCDTDSGALGVVEQARENGILVPQTVSVVGFVDYDWSRYLAVPLTTVHQPRESLGQQAVEMLYELQDRPREQRVTHRVELIPELMIRRSSAPPSSGST
ncbi:MAG: LacI family transcriptional regulator [Kiritimatiellales bacterium]|nr:LacI family transcriptional regulator [Kiritimatiellales bacterium]